MKNKILSGGIYRESLKRLKILTIIFAALILVFQTVPAVFSAYFYPDSGTTVVTFTTVCSWVATIATVGSFIAVLLTFSPFNKRSYSDFAHSLPYTRSCLFFSKLAALYTCVLGLMALSVITGIAIYTILGKYFIINYVGFVSMLLRFISASMFLISCFTIAMSLTGTMFSNLTAAGLLVFFPRFVIYLFTTAISESLPFLCDSSYLPVLSVRYNTLLGIFSLEDLFSSLLGNASGVPEYGPIVYTFAVAIIYTAIGYVLFRKRKSETAENPAPSRTVQSVIRILIGLTFSIPATFLIILGDDEMTFTLAVILYFLALIAYFAYELITRKSWKSLLHAIPALGIVVAVNMLVVGAFFGTKIVAASYLPAADDVDSVRMISNNGMSIFDSDNNYFDLASGIEISDVSVKKEVTDALRDNVNEWKNGTYHKFYSEKYSYPVSFGIKTGGITRYRSIYLTPEQRSAILEGISSNEEYKKIYMNLPEPIEGTLKVDNSFKMMSIYDVELFGNILNNGKNIDETKEILDTLQGEINELGFTEWYSLCNGNTVFTEPEEHGYLFYLSYEVKNYVGKEIRITVYSEIFPKTFELLMKYSSELNEKDDYDTIMKMVEKNPTISSDEYLDFSVNVIIDGKEYYYYPDTVDVIEDGDKGYSTKVDEKIIELIKGAEKSGKDPKANKFMVINANYSKWIDGDYKDLETIRFMPLPDDFKIENYPQLVNLYEEEAVYAER